METVIQVERESLEDGTIIYHFTITMGDGQIIRTQARQRPNEHFELATTDRDRDINRHLAEVLLMALTKGSTIPEIVEQPNE
jgi:hypothetical protein